jgi:hypothetical protein
MQIPPFAGRQIFLPGDWLITALHKVLPEFNPVANLVPDRLVCENADAVLIDQPVFHNSQPSDTHPSLNLVRQQCA